MSAVKLARKAACFGLLALALGAGWSCGWRDGSALARTPVRRARAVDAPDSHRSPSAGAPVAPSGPALTTGAPQPGAAEEEPAAVGSGQGEADPLVSNGLGSPLCRGVLGEATLSQTSRRNCQTSGFVAAPAPTGDYGLDVHIDTGFLGLSSGELLTAVQDLFVTPVWMALVWAVHAIVVMLEWCFTIDLLDSATVGGLGRGLREMQGSFTQPWLATVLAAGSMLALYNGLIRRRVAQTVGEALLVLMMMSAGTWVILDPSGTVGALGGWANQASLGTLAVAARGSPAEASGALAESMGAVFSAAVETPWCYLEFGNVGWCRNPQRLDPRLRAAALRIATIEAGLVGCTGESSSLAPCAARGSAQARALEHSAELLRDARSNGAIFLALPANGPARNSINESESLLRVMCQSSEATHCRGPMSAEAEFRTGSGTWSRVGGLLLIVAGVLGMLLLLGFIGLRLLTAAVFSLLYLLLAPAAVLAPALGEGGRLVFRRWAGQLLGAVVAKLLFSFLLGVVLAIFAILASLEALGWWTQWLLMSAFWWGAYARRHQALSIGAGALGREREGRPRPIVRRVSDALDSPRKVLGVARSARDRLSKPPGPERGRLPVHLGRGAAAGGVDEQVARVLESERRDAGSRTGAAPAIRERLSALRAQLERLNRAREQAVADRDTRRKLELGHRAERVEAELAREQDAFDAARRVASEGARAKRPFGRGEGEARVPERARFLDAQAALPPGGRNYAALAGLAGHGREEYERLDRPSQRRARLVIDRELALRKDLAASSGDAGASPAAPTPGGPAPDRSARPLERAIERRARAEGQRPPSSVMSDAHAVASRRKRQLGRDRD